MIVSRMTYAARRGGDEAGPSHANLLSLLTEFMKRSWPHVHAWRLYWWPVGQPKNLLVMEIEYESFEAYEKSSAEMLADPEVSEFQRKMRELTERAVTEEIWQVAGQEPVDPELLREARRIISDEIRRVAPDKFDASWTDEELMDAADALFGRRMRSSNS